MIIGLLHPGEMGSALGGRLAEAGHDVVWASDGRSASTRARAEADGLRDVITLDKLVADADLIISLCPPHAAGDVAAAVAARRFRGLYLDANAVSPRTVGEVADTVCAAGAEFVDGGVIGGPPVNPEMPTHVYLSGQRAGELLELTSSPCVEIAAVSQRPGDASALKLCFAAWTKGTDALLLAIRTAAATLGVDAALVAEWEQSQPGLDARSTQAAISAARKAWRFAGEMREIATMFGDVGVPGGMHLGAAEVFGRVSRMSVDRDDALERIVAAIRDTSAATTVQ